MRTCITTYVRPQQSRLDEKLDTLLEETTQKMKRHQRRRKKRQEDGAHWLPVIPQRGRGPGGAPTLEQNEQMLRQVQRNGKHLRVMINHVIDRDEDEVVAADTVNETGDTAQAPLSPRADAELRAELKAELKAELIPELMMLAQGEIHSMLLASPAASPTR